MRGKRKERARAVWGEKGEREIRREARERESETACVREMESERGAAVDYSLHYAV